MKQIDRIRNMNAEELADELGSISACPFCIKNNQHCGASFFTDCIKGVKAWLESEVENNES